MSGGHWNYAGIRLRDELENIAEDEIVQRRFPRLGAALNVLAKALHDIEREMDWDICCDSMIEDDVAFERDALAKLSGRVPHEGSK